MMMMKMLLAVLVLVPLGACSQQAHMVSRPDFVVYVPHKADQSDGTNQHFLVVPANNGDFLAFWTQATRENDPDQHVAMSRSRDRGRHWTKPEVIAGDPQGKSGLIASWQFPVVVPHTGRIYLFWNQNVGIVDAREDTTGALAYRWSDDHGHTWSRPLQLSIRKSAISNPEPGSPENWVVYQAPVVMPGGEVIVGFTRWASTAVQKEGGLFERDSEVWFLRFDNIFDEPDPAKLTVTTLPDGEHGLRVPCPGKRAAESGMSIAQEPTVHELSDGRFITVMRTRTGYIWYALSADRGHSWDEPRPLRFSPDGEPVPQPLAPCPLYKLADGRFVLIFHNNDGSANGGTGPTDSRRVRRPVWISVGREIEHPDHPITFSTPQILADNGGAKRGPVDHTQIGTYPSLFEYEGKVYFWYPDRKHYLLGKIVYPELLNQELPAWPRGQEPQAWQDRDDEDERR